MSLLVVLGVSLAVFLYLRAMRSNRRAWLKKLDLPGRWRLLPAPAADGEESLPQSEELLLKGGVQQGDYVWTQQAPAGQSLQNRQGRWRVVGNRLELTEDGGETVVLQLHLFQPGQIGLEDSRGRRRIFSKSVDNVVPLRKRG